MTAGRRPRLASAAVTALIRTCTPHCSVRGRWWRRCRCSGYAALDLIASMAPGPRSLIDR